MSGFAVAEERAKTGAPSREKHAYETPVLLGQVSRCGRARYDGRPTTDVMPPDLCRFCWEWEMARALR